MYRSCSSRAGGAGFELDGTACSAHRSSTLQAVTRAYSLRPSVTEPTYPIGTSLGVSVSNESDSEKPVCRDFMFPGSLYDNARNPVLSPSTRNFSLVSLKIAPSLAFVIARCDAAPIVRTRDSLSRCAARTTWPHYVAIVVTCLVCAELRTLLGSHPSGFGFDAGFRSGPRTSPRTGPRSGPRSTVTSVT